MLLDSPEGMHRLGLRLVDEGIPEDDVKRFLEAPYEDRLERAKIIMHLLESATNASGRALDAQHKSAVSRARTGELDLVYVTEREGRRLIMSSPYGFALGRDKVTGSLFAVDLSAATYPEQVATRVAEENARAARELEAVRNLVRGT